MLMLPLAREIAMRASRRLDSVVPCRTSTTRTIALPLTLTGVGGVGWGIGLVAHAEMSYAPK